MGAHFVAVIVDTITLLVSELKGCDDSCRILREGSWGLLATALDTAVKVRELPEFRPYFKEGITR